jgi:hypothetical protein
VTQTNITLSAIAGGSLWCQPSGGDWALTAHTAPQAQQTTYADLLERIDTATTVAAVQAIAWP